MLVPETTANDFGRALFVTVTAGPGPIVTLSTAVDAVTSSPRLVALNVTVVTAALYGPTNGPPPPTGAAPAGWTKSVPVTASADRKSTRLNSSHGYISYAVFCLKKKKNNLANTYN